MSPAAGLTGQRQPHEENDRAMLPALQIKCECQECQRHRRDIAAQHRYYQIHSEPPMWLYASGLDSTSADEPMCSGGCETHSSCADAGMVCGHCDECDSLCSCEKCGNCGSLAGECDCCGSCGSSYGCGYCHDCDVPSCECECSDEDNDSSSDGSGNGFGTVTVAPWVRRGYVSEPYRYNSYGTPQWHDVWGVDRSIDLCQSAADYYLLEALAGGIVSHGAPNDAYLAMLRSEARGQMAGLVARLDKTFTGYVDAIIGGELRHHRASGSLRRHGRKDAWLEWHAIRESVGVVALADAADLFLDFNNGGYGGAPWANIANVLHARLTGKISPQLFVDRVFNLQHNGGSLFDKGSWGVENGAGWSYYELMNWVLPAHGRNPEPAWTILLGGASPEVKELFEAMWRAGNAARRAMGTRGYRPCPSLRLPITRTYNSYYGSWYVELDTRRMGEMLRGLDVEVAA